LHIALHERFKIAKQVILIPSSSLNQLYQALSSLIQPLSASSSLYHPYPAFTSLIKPHSVGISFSWQKS
jgi:hypothetical protein